ncbi:hypothetical protein [Natrarchaeobius chitinivorans]|uniref:Uncharacterized protein n=1 Tax=Natrarchaeobius chitinivorans TaxID=1679083 RepID=A0A3N6LYE9_NATCH|nr:hypothetical protein [Natrarchaeobius chitinivorans]RQG94107.1 hypothetical protein EA473_13005 [Natrarchaeobius chitinivorans]
MRRRRFLAGAVVGGSLLPGCSALSASETEPEPDSNDRPQFGVDDADSESNGDDTDEPKPTERGSPFDEPTVVDFETAPLTAAVVNGRVSTDDGLSMHLEFAEPATAESPATLVATVENRRPYEQTFRPRRLLVLDDPASSRSSDDRNVTVYLAPAADHPLAETSPGYDRDGGGRWRLETVRDDWFPDLVTLGAEERVTGEHYLLGDHRRGDEPIEAGRYEFTRRGDGFEIAIWSTDEPGPDADSSLADATVPSQPDETDVRWYHDATPETPVFLEPSHESVTAPAKIEFDLVNHGRESLSGNPYYWRLFKLEGGRWFPIDPWEWPMPAAAVRPGGVDESELFVYDGDPAERWGTRTVGHLGGGRYAYTVGYSADDETHAAAFDLEAPPLEVSVELDIAIDDEGETIVVELPNYEEARRPATVTVSHAGSDGDFVDLDQRLVPEQLPRRPFRALRNSLPLFENGVETVRVKTDRGTALRRFGYEEDETRTIAYDGDLFETTGSLEE